MFFNLGRCSRDIIGKVYIPFLLDAVIRASVEAITASTCGCPDHIFLSSATRNQFGILRAKYSVCSSLDNGWSSRRLMWTTAEVGRFFLAGAGVGVFYNLLL